MKLIHNKNLLVVYKNPLKMIKKFKIQRKVNSTFFNVLIKVEKIKRKYT
jgi:hypothetical protein